MEASVATYPPYNKVYGIATHNSYWINRSDQLDLGASGTQELISDQLLHDHVRALELDLHTEGGGWKIYHTSDSEDFLGRNLRDYLDYLRNFQYAVPQHDVINVIIELKNVVPSNHNWAQPTPAAPILGPGHTIHDFDAWFRAYLGPWLYTPADFLARCPGAATMVECAAKAGWPTIDELRGKFIVNLVGNWSTMALDWALYATTDLRDRVAFPMQTVFSLQEQPDDPNSDDWFKATDPGGTSYWISDIYTTVRIGDIEISVPCPYIDPATRQTAFEASVFWQLEDPRAFNLGQSSLALAQSKAFLRRGGVIRGRDAYKMTWTDLAGGNDSVPEIAKSSDQWTELKSGIQLIQTDYPWHVLNDEAPSALGIPTDPSRRLRDESWVDGPPGATSGAFHEPGARFYFHSPLPSEAWAYATVPAGSQRWWETTVSTTRNGDTWTIRGSDDVLLSYPRRAQEGGSGSIRLQSEDGQDAIVIVRRKETQPGASYYQEKVVVGIIVVQDGQQTAAVDFPAARYGPCKSSLDPNSDDVSSVCVGSMIALSIVTRTSWAAVTAFSAGKTVLDPALLGATPNTPDWKPLGTWYFNQPLTQHGFSGSGDVLLAGPRTATSITIQAGVPGLPAAEPTFTRLTDLPNREVFNGPSEDAAIVDLSEPLGVGHHFYTTSVAERDNAIANYGYTSEGTACYVFDSQVSGSTPLYRLLNPSNGDHFYTTSATERDIAIASYGYSSEGTACYVFDSQVSGSTPLYRLLNPSNGDHFYTTSVAERDNAIASYGYSSEGTACYVFDSQVAATVAFYRLLR